MAAIRGRRPASRGQGWGRKAPPRRGLGLTAARCDVIVLRLWGEQGLGRTVGDRGRGQRVVSRRVVKAEMRGLVTAGPGVRLERSAGLRTSVARAPPGGHRLLIASGRVAPRAVGLRRFDPSTVGSGPGVSSRAAPPATSTSRQVRGRQRRWRSPLVSCAGLIRPSGHASAGCRHGHGHGPRPGPDPNGA